MATTGSGGRVERLPFTVYDIVGYFVPGFIFTFGSVVLFSWENLSSIDCWLRNDTGRLIFAAVMSCVICYSVGHVISLIAAETIEKLLISFTGYPSKYLTEVYKFDCPYAERTITRNRRDAWKSRSFKVRYFLFLFHSASFEMLNRIKGAFHVFLKPLEVNSIKLLDKRLKTVFEISLSDVKGSEWFQLVENYVTHHAPHAAQRMYNYVTLYGFCRNMSMALYALTLLSILAIWAKGLAINIFFVTYLLVTLAVSFLLLFGFLKFFRRYSTEAILNFVVMDMRDDEKDSSG